MTIFSLHIYSSSCLTESEFLFSFCPLLFFHSTSPFRTLSLYVSLWHQTPAMTWFTPTGSELCGNASEDVGIFFFLGFLRSLFLLFSHSCLCFLFNWLSFFIILLFHSSSFSLSVPHLSPLYILLSPSFLSFFPSASDTLIPQAHCAPFLYAPLCPTFHLYIHWGQFLLFLIRLSISLRQHCGFTRQTTTSLGKCYFAEFYFASQSCQRYFVTCDLRFMASGQMPSLNFTSRID